MGLWIFFIFYLISLSRSTKINILMDTIFASKYLSVLRVSSLYFFYIVIHLKPRCTFIPCVVCFTTSPPAVVIHIWGVSEWIGREIEKESYVWVG